MADISTELAQQLIKDQFSKWAALPIRPVAQSGHDNRTFHLGDKMTIRLPSGPDYVPQIEKEAKRLPFLANHLPFPISCPVAQGKPSAYYPFPWAVYRYIEGEPVHAENIGDPKRFAVDLANFLRMLQAIEVTGAPAAGKHNFYRGASPRVYHAQVENALQSLHSILPVSLLQKKWMQATRSQWEGPPVWLHGDIAPGNLLVKNGSLCGVIDFGIMGIGDPACDYAMAWTFFSQQDRAYFLQGLDQGTIQRARGWALWKALITYNDTDALLSLNAKHTLNEIIREEEA